MLAVVLSGGGNHGALQAGALEVFIEAGIKPQLWVGTSAGGLNSIMMAADPTLKGVRALQEIWIHARPVPQAAAALIVAAGRFTTGKESFFPSESVAEYFRAHMPKGLDTFGDLHARSGLRAFTLAVEYPLGASRVFGAKKDDRLLDGAMATSAFPPYFPPWEVGPKRYVDGGVAANLPLRTAVCCGADEILALEVHGPMIMVPGSGLLEVAGFALNAMIDQQTADQIESVEQGGIRMHTLRLDPGPVAPWDFSRAEFLVERGRQMARKFLDSGEKIPGGPTWRYRRWRLFGRAPQLERW